jgi:hypothetical protein
MRYLIHVMEKIECVIDTDRESVLLRASLTLLFIEILPKLKNVPLASMLFQNLLKLAILSNLSALQYATLDRIVTFVKSFEPLKNLKLDEDFSKIIEMAVTALASDTESESNIWSQNLNYG